MRRARRRVKAKGGAKLPAAKRSRSNESSRVRDLEKRPAEALKREAEALEQQTTIDRGSGDLRPQGAC
jgi:hypothetical protein